MSTHPGRLLNLDGKVALVSGGSGGIGSETVRMLLAAGATVWSLDLPGSEAPEGARALVADLTRPDEIAAAVAKVEAAHGRLDFLIHCAGVTRDGVLWKLSEQDWNQVLAVNLTSAFHLLGKAAPLMRAAGGGSVVLVSSINGTRGKFGQANYAASKAGLDALAKVAARELGLFRVRVNSVAPGWVTTRMTAKAPPQERSKAIAESVLDRGAEPEDVAGVILFLCSPLSRHVTGQVIRVDGGQLIA